jgi:hypothetical protein
VAFGTVPTKIPVFVCNFLKRFGVPDGI